MFNDSNKMRFRKEYALEPTATVTSVLGLQEYEKLSACKATRTFQCLCLRYAWPTLQMAGCSV